jgi:hypothetical protein
VNHHDSIRCRLFEVRRFDLWARSLVAVGLALAALVLSACASAGGTAQFTLDSLTSPGRGLRGDFDSGTYAFDGPNHITAVLLQGPSEHPVMAAVIRMFWYPTAGQTAIEKTSTNATINYMIFTGEKEGEVGVYSGAGFVKPGGEPGDATLAFALEESHLRLSDGSGRFQDVLGTAAVTGRCSVTHDDLTTKQNLHQLDVLVSQRLAYPRLVAAPQRDSSTAQVVTRTPTESAYGAAMH